MLDIKEYKKISLDFRRVASNFLRTEYTNQDIPLQRFYSYIEKESTIKNIILNKIDGIREDLSTVELVTANNYKDIAKLKAVK